MKKQIDVVAAALLHEQQVFLAQRRVGDLGGGFWEFPGGKVEEGESLEEALHREIREELGVEIKILDSLGFHLHEYEQIIVKLYVFSCSLLNHQITLSEHQNSKWLTIADVKLEELVEADRPFISRLLSRYSDDQPDRK